MDTVEKVAAAMKAAGFKSGPQYLGELRLAHVEAGYETGSWLTRCFRLCKKALERDQGPVRRAPEVQAVQVAGPHSKATKLGKRGLTAPALSYLWAMTWMLREIELRQISWCDIKVQEEDKLVTLRIKKSKMDQAGAGVRRTLACCGKTPCHLVCPRQLTKKLMKHRDKDNDLVFLTKEGKIPTKQDVVNSWRWASATSCTGRSARRSGAMHYVRLGMSISELAYLGRWKSSAVLTYAEEALEEVAANRFQSRNGQKQSESMTTTSRPATELHPPQASDEDPVTPQEDQAPGQAEESAWPRVVNLPNSLWVVTKGKGSTARPIHLVTQASWAIPISRWNTACGWAFAEKSSEFHFVPKPSLGQKKCRKCLALRDGRDQSQGGDDGA